MFSFGIDVSEHEQNSSDLETAAGCATRNGASFRSRCGADASSAADPQVGLLPKRSMQPWFHYHAGDLLSPATSSHRLDRRTRFSHLASFDSLPPHRCFPEASVSSGQAFAALDRLLDEARTGPFYLRQPRLADLVVDAIHYNASYTTTLRTPSPFCPITSIYSSRRRLLLPN